MSDKSSVELVERPQRPNISFNGRLLYSETSSPEKRVDGLSRSSETIYFVLSPLLFYGVEYLQSLISEDSLIIAVEADFNLYNFTLKLFRKDNFPDVEYIHISQLTADKLEKIFSRSKCRKIIPVKLNVGYMQNRKQYDALLRTSTALLESFWKNRMTTIHMGRLWCRNIFQNLPNLISGYDISALKTSKPVIVAGAGESLEDSIPVLKKFRSRFFLAAADTAVNSLLVSGITPDLIIAVESQHANLYDFYNSSSLDIPIAFDLTSSPELLRKHGGKSYFFISRFYPSAIFSILGKFNLCPSVIPPLGSVGISSLYIALSITDKEVFYTGLDFSFIPDKYHVSEAPSHILNMLNESRTNKTGFFSAAYNGHRIPETDKSGRRVYTDIIMQSYSESLSRLSQSSGRLFDIGRKGLPSQSPLITEKELESRLSSNQSADLLPHPEQEVIFGNEPDLTDLFSSEEVKIKNAVEDVISFRNGERSDEDFKSSLLNRLTDLDYTWLFFPDREPLPSLSASFLKRFLYSASWFLNTVRNASALYQSSDLNTDKKAF